MLENSALPSTDSTDNSDKEEQARTFNELLSEAQEALQWLEARHAEQRDIEVGDISAPQTMEEVEDLAQWLHNLVASSDDKKARQILLVKTVSALFAELRSPEDKRIKEIADLLTTYIKRRRRWILRRFGKTLPFPSGEIKIRVIPTSVELPRSVAPLVKTLIDRRGAKKKYLTVKYELNLRAIAQAPWSIRQLVRLAGGWVGRHENVSVKFADRKEAVLLSSRRYFGPTRTGRRTDKK